MKTSRRVFNSNLVLSGLALGLGGPFWANDAMQSKGFCLAANLKKPKANVKVKLFPVEHFKKIFDQQIRKVNGKAKELPSDAKLLADLKKWLRKVKFGGNEVAIKLDENNVFEFSSNVKGLNIYFIRIDDKALIKDILVRGKKGKDVAESYGNNVRDVEIFQGWIVLKRGIQTVVENGVVVRNRVYEWYKMDVWTVQCDIIVPSFTVYFDSYSRYRTKKEWWTEQQLRDLGSSARIFAPNDTVYLDWHVFATTYDLNRSIHYLRTTSKALQVQRPEVQSVHALSNVRMEGTHQVHQRIFLSGTSARSTYERDDGLFPGVNLNNIQPPYMVRSTTGDRNMDELPKHRFPEGSIEATLFLEDLASRYGDNVFYAGNSMLGVRLNEITSLAVLVGRRSSPYNYAVEGEGGLVARDPRAPQGPPPHKDPAIWATLGAEAAAYAVDKYWGNKIDYAAVDKNISECVDTTYTEADCEGCLWGGQVGDELADENTDLMKSALSRAAGATAAGCIIGGLTGVGIGVGCAIGAIIGAILAASQALNESKVVDELENEWFSKCEQKY